MLIPLLGFGVAALTHRYLQMYAPSNAIVAKVRRERPRLRSAAGLLVLAAALASGALVLAQRVANGGPGWMNLIILITIWDALKFTLSAFGLFASRVVSACGQAPSMRLARRAATRDTRG